MTRHECIDDFLAHRRLALVGVSRKPKDFSRMVYRELRGRGYDVVPVNPQVSEIEGAACYRDVREIRPPVEGALLMCPPQTSEQVVRDCEAAGITRVWLHRSGGQGSVSPEAVAYCQSHGISVVPGECPYMFLPRAGACHRLHGLIRKIRGTYPK